MNEPMIVEWGGGGSGFVRYQPPDRPRPPAPFISAAENMIVYPTVQPPVRIGNQERCPVWCLVHIEVEEFGPHWCFTVQGRDGAFGGSGSCQFLFANAREDPLAVWRTGINMIGPDGRLGYQTVREASFPPPAASALFDPLAALRDEQGRVPVAGDPLQVAAVITALLGVLPLAVIRSRIWATFLLKRPVLEDSTVVSGHWPAELADHDIARRTRQWLGEISPAALRDDDRADQALHWVADEAARGALLYDYRTQADIPAFLDKVIQDELGIRVQDVPRLLGRNPDGLRNPKAMAMVTEWAYGAPESAIAHLVPPRLPPDLAGVMLDGVLEAHHRAAPGRNPARFPPAGEAPYPGWHSFLAKALIRRMPRKADRIEFVRTMLLAPGRPLAEPGAVHRAVSWLHQLGISPDDPTIFPPSVETVVMALSHSSGTINASQRAFLLNSADPPVVLRQVVDRLPRIDPWVASQLLDAMADPGVRKWLLREIIGHNRRRADGTTRRLSDWVDELASFPRADQRAIIDGAYGLLADEGQLSDSMLGHALKVYAAIPDTEDAARRLLIEASTRLTKARADSAVGEFGPVGSSGPQTAAWTSGGRYDQGFGTAGPATWVDRRQPDRNGRTSWVEHDARTEQPPAGSGQRGPRTGEDPYEERSPAMVLLVIMIVGLVIAFAVYNLFIARLG